MITEKDISEYRQIILEEYGVDISNEKAVEELTSLVNMIRSITQLRENYLIPRHSVDEPGKRMAL